MKPWKFLLAIVLLIAPSIFILAADLPPPGQDYELVLNQDIEDYDISPACVSSPEQMIVLRCPENPMASEIMLESNTHMNFMELPGQDCQMTLESSIGPGDIQRLERG